MFARDMREGERRTSPKTQFPLQALGRFPPQQLRSRPNARGPHFEEVAIPKRTAAFSVDCSCLPLFLKPKQDMANA